MPTTNRTSLNQHHHTGAKELRERAGNLCAHRFLVLLQQLADRGNHLRGGNLPVGHTDEGGHRGGDGALAASGSALRNADQLGVTATGYEVANLANIGCAQEWP